MLGRVFARECWNDYPVCPFAKRAVELRSEPLTLSHTSAALLVGTRHYCHMLRRADRMHIRLLCGRYCSSDVLVTVEKRPTRRASRAGATPRNFWAARPKKSRVAPARFSLFSTVTFLGIAFCICSVSDRLPAPQGDETGEEGGGGCNPYLLHPFPSGVLSAAPTRRSNSALKWTVTGWSTPPNSWRTSASVTRPAFHPRYRCSNRSPVNRVLA